jgi:hypothetical protein
MKKKVADKKTSRHSDEAEDKKLFKKMMGNHPDQGADKKLFKGMLSKSMKKVKK